MYVISVFWYLNCNERVCRASQTVKITKRSITVLCAQLLSDCCLLYWGARIAHSVWYLGYGLDI